MNTQRTSGHSRDDLWFHTQGEEDQTLTKCSGIFRRDAEPTVSLFTHIRGGKKTTTLSIVQVVGSHTIEYMEIRSAYNPKFQPIPIPQLLSHYPNAVTREVFSTFDKQKVGGWHFRHLSQTPDQYEIFWLEVPYITHHGHPSHHGMCFFRKKLRSQAGDIDMGGQRCYCHGQFSHINLGTRYLHCPHTANKKNMQNLALHSPLRLKQINHFSFPFRKILDQVACLEEQFGNEAFPFPPQQLVHVFFSLLAKFIFSEIRSSLVTSWKWAVFVLGPRNSHNSWNQPNQVVWDHKVQQKSIPNLNYFSRFVTYKITTSMSSRQTNQPIDSERIFSPVLLRCTCPPRPLRTRKVSMARRYTRQRRSREWRPWKRRPSDLRVAPGNAPHWFFGG